MINSKPALLLLCFCAFNCIVFAQSPPRFIQINLYESGDAQALQNSTPFANINEAGDFRKLENKSFSLYLTKRIRQETNFNFGLGFTYLKQRFGSDLSLPNLIVSIPGLPNLSTSDQDILLRWVEMRNQYIFVPFGLTYNFLEDKKKSRLYLNMEMRPHLLIRSSIEPEYWRFTPVGGRVVASEVIDSGLKDHFKDFSTRFLFQTKVGLGMSISLRQGRLPRQTDYGVELSWISYYHSPTGGLNSGGSGFMGSFFVRFARDPK